MKRDRRTKTELLDEIKDLNDSHRRRCKESDKLFMEKMKLHQELQYMRRHAKTAEAILERKSTWGNISYRRAEYNKKLIHILERTISDLIKGCPFNFATCPKCGAVVKIKGDKKDGDEEKSEQLGKVLCLECLPDEPSDRLAFTCEGPDGHENKVDINLNYALAK